MRKFYVHGYRYGNGIPFEAVWESSHKEGSFVLGYDKVGGRFTYGQDPEDFYNNVCNSLEEVISSINNSIDIISMEPFKDMHYYKNKREMLTKMLIFLANNY